MVHTQQEQFHFSRRLLPIFSKVFVNHFGPLLCSFIFLTHCAPHGSKCTLQDCCFSDNITQKMLPIQDCMPGSVLKKKAFPEQCCEVEKLNFPFEKNDQDISLIRPQTSKQILFSIQSQFSSIPDVYLFVFNIPKPNLTPIFSTPVICYPSQYGKVICLSLRGHYE